MGTNDYFTFEINEFFNFITKANIIISWSSLIVLYLAFKTWKGVQIRSKLPRFPGSYIPWFGNYKYELRGKDRIEFNLLEAQRKLKSGAITISLPSLNTYNVVITDINLTKECFIRNGAYTSARLFVLFEGFSYFYDKYFTPKFSIIGSSGKFWHDIRRKSFGILRELGVGKNRLEELINVEVQYLLENLASKKGSSNKEEISNVFATASTNVICQLSYGMRFSYDDPEFISLYRSLKILFDGTVLTNTKILFPEILRRAPLIYNQEVEDYVSSVTHIREFSRKHVKIQKHSFRQNSSDYEMNQEDCLLKKFVQHFHLNPTVQAEDIMVSVMWDMFIAGTDTTSLTLAWAVYFLRNHQDIQNLLKIEIAENISSDQISYSDMGKLPLCHAFLLETQRFGAIAPFAGPHVVTKEFSAGGYTFPKGIVLEMSIFCMSRDKKVFRNPDNFDINNFLNNGKVEVPDEFIPFGIGPRICFGEKIARIEGFVFFTNIVRHFTFSPMSSQDSTDDNSSNMGLTRSPKDFSVNITSN